ncbi:MAG: hypothetical protein SFZ24_10455 [Planctomycetota bacterium]|nr:hypothetical protein [Planctomycetota bacterium]
MRAARGRGAIAAGAAVLVFSGARAGDFADGVVAYAPAPGQFVNNAQFNQPSRALGPPGVAGGTLAPDNSKAVTLGGFGGSIVLRFSEPVLDDPCNPFGLDAVVYGNGFYVGGAAGRRWAEAGIVEISRDANGNGVADDPWFVIRGSHLPESPASVLESQRWDLNAATPDPPANLGWYPAGAPASFVTTTFGLPALFDTFVLENPNGVGAALEGVWGYADCSPTLVLGDLNGDNVVDTPGMSAGAFYTSPDNPRAAGVTPGSGGGDAFDIRWARDPETGAAAGLASFDFVRISTGANFLAAVLGEVSTEVSAVADVRPREAFFDRTGDGAADVEDLYRWQSLRMSGDSSADLDGDGVTNEADRAMMMRCVRRNETSDAGTAR